MPVFPAVASTMVPPVARVPSCSARRMIPMAARSFTLPPGFKYSNLAKTSAHPEGTRRFNCSMGVAPTSCVMSSATRRWDIADAFRLTLQGTGTRRKSSNSSSHSLGPIHGRPFGPRVVAALGADDHFAVAFGFGFDAHYPEPSGASGIGGLVADRILIADVMGDGAADLVHFIKSLGEESHPARTFRDHIQSALRPFRVLFISEDSDRVDLRPVFFLQVLDGLL